MKPPKFRVGQAVVLIKSGPWQTVFNAGLSGADPVQGPIYTVEDSEQFEGEWYVVLEGFTASAYLEDNFAPAELLPD